MLPGNDLGEPKNGADGERFAVHPLEVAVVGLRGLSTGDFQEALKSLLGEEAAGLSPANISRLLAGWVDEYQQFRTRDLMTAITYISGRMAFPSTSGSRRIVSARW
jgi:hypothetical protein